MGSIDDRPDILVVGGGLAGLFCALECTRNGFRPLVLESRTSVQTAGDFITIGPTAIRALCKWPTIAKAIDKVAYNPHIYYHKQDGELVAGPMPAHENFGRIISRPALHTMLMEAITAEGVELRHETKVTRYFETQHTGGVELSNGERIEAAMVVAADGIHSKSWTIVSGEEPEVHPSGLAMFRTAFPLEKAMTDQSLHERWLPDEHEDKMGFFLGQGSFGIVLFGQDTASWVWQHKDSPETSRESWSATLSPEDALKQLDQEGPWGSDLRKLIATTPPRSIVDWRLMTRNLRKQWVSQKGRLVQIGDAAHPFLPTTVNGGTQALEDGVSLACCLRLSAKDGASQALPDGARVHNILRIDRVGAIERTGMERTRKHHQIDFEKVKKNPELIRNEPARWQIEHDPEQYAQENFADCLACLRSGKVFVNTNKPAEFTFES